MVMKQKHHTILHLLIFVILFSPIAHAQNEDVLTIDESRICEVNRVGTVERITNREYPSVFGAWHHELLNFPIPEDIYSPEYFEKMLAFHDLFFRGSGHGLQWRSTPDGMRTVGPWWVAEEAKSRIHSQNPNFLHLVPIYYYGANPETYSEESPYWLRDKAGNRVQDEGWSELLIDFTQPEAQDHFVQQAIAIAQCGIFDGIFMDWWSEHDEWNQELADLYHGDKVGAQISILKRIREAVGDDFLIIVNSRIQKIPRSSPYVNGAFMEGHPKHTREYLIEVESTLLWNEENFRYPQTNCLEAWGIPTEPLNSRLNQKWMRTFTALSLTHSDGYVSYVTGFWGTSHTHHYEIWQGHSDQHTSGDVHDHTHQKYWHSFWDADLGKPIGEKGQQYITAKDIAIDGLYIREYANGWAVYNRSGKARKIQLPEKGSGVASGVKNRRWHTIPDLDGEIYLKTNPTNNLKNTDTIAVIPAWDVNKDGNINIDDIRLVIVDIGVDTPTTLRADVNGDGRVTVADLQLVIDNLDNPTTAEAPTLENDSLTAFNAESLRAELNRIGTDTSAFSEAITLLQHLLANIRPQKTALLANYPNPFNPETWIPYHLATPSDVVIIIYDAQGIVVRHLDLGHRDPGYYTNPGRAAYWDGRNEIGERVASGIYFYQLQADNLSLLRKMLILK